MCILSKKLFFCDIFIGKLSLIGIAFALYYVPVLSFLSGFDHIEDLTLYLSPKAAPLTPKRLRNPPGSREKNSRKPPMAMGGENCQKAAYETVPF
jgi:hypothetical protein